MDSNVKQLQMVQFNKRYQNNQDMLQNKRQELNVLQKDIDKLVQKRQQTEKKIEQLLKKNEQLEKKNKQINQEVERTLRQGQRKLKQLIQKALRDIRGTKMEPIEPQQQKPRSVKKVVPEWMLKETLVDPSQKIQKAKEAFLMPEGKLRSKMHRYGIFA